MHFIRKKITVYLIYLAFFKKQLTATDCEKHEFENLITKNKPNFINIAFKLIKSAFILNQPLVKIKEKDKINVQMLHIFPIYPEHLQNPLVKVTQNTLVFYEQDVQNPMSRHEVPGGA